MTFFDFVLAGLAIAIGFYLLPIVMMIVGGIVVGALALFVAIAEWIGRALK